MKKLKIAILDMAPSHYRAPIYERLARKKDVEEIVYFSSNAGLKKKYVQAYGKKIKWEVGLMGFRNEFLKNYYPDKSTLRFTRMWNFGIINKIRKEKFDAIVVVSYTPLSHKLAILTALATKTPIIFKEEIDLIQKNDTIKWKIKEKIFKYVFKKMQAFIYGYKKNKEFYEYYGAPKEKLFFFPCAVDNDSFQKQRKNLPSKEDLKRSLKIPNQTKIVGITGGRLARGKRNMDTVKAFEELGEDYFLMIYGSGESEKEIKDYIKRKKLKNIKLLGFVPQSKLGKYFKASDIYILASEIDRSPKPLNETMNFGVVPIVSDMVPTVPDLIKGKKTGFSYKNGDVKEMKRIIKNLASNKKELNKRSKNSEELVKKWSFDEDVKGLMRAIKYVTKNSN